MNSIIKKTVLYQLVTGKEYLPEINSEVVAVPNRC